MIGVDYDLFWTLNPKSLSPFLKAFELKKKYDDRIAWQTGAYIRYAIASTLGKGNHYPPEPLSEKGRSREMTPEEIREKMMRNMEVINTKLSAKGGND